MSANGSVFANARLTAPPHALYEKCCQLSKHSIDHHMRKACYLGGLMDIIFSSHIQVKVFRVVSIRCSTRKSSGLDGLALVLRRTPKGKEGKISNAHLPWPWDVNVVLVRGMSNQPRLGLFPSQPSQPAFTPSLLFYAMSRALEHHYPPPR
jgi:hypothetical protein